MNILQDRAALAVLAVLSVLAVICVTGADISKDASDMTGVISDVRTTEKGSTFILTDSVGSEIRCFFRGDVNEGGVYIVKGSFSGDGSMFFVSSLDVV